MLKTLHSMDVGLSAARPVAVQDSTFFAGESFREHDHGYYEALVILEGELSHRLNGRDETLSPGRVRLVRPADRHRLHVAPSTPKCHLMNVCFLPELLVETLAVASRGVTFPLEAEDEFLTAETTAAERHNLLAKMELLKEHAARPEHADFLRPAFVGLLLDFLLVLEQRRRTLSKLPPPWLSTAREAMRKKENFVVGLPAFVALAGRSQEHLTRLLRQHFNDTPQAYINRLRVQEAARQLCNTRRSLDEVMFDVGFQNHSYFRRCFAKVFSCPPGQYRKRARGGFAP